MKMLERAGEACFAVADAIRCAESEAHAKEQMELCLALQDLPDEYATAIRWIAERAIQSAFAGNPKATMRSGLRRAVRG